MADEVNHESRYVKLKKEQAPLEDITPGELNMPIDVPQLHVQKCNECGQPLPESYQAPADEPWTTGVFECAQDPESCWKGLFCPCILFGHNFEQVRDDATWTSPCMCHAIFVEGGLALAIATAALHGMIDPGTTCLIYEGLFFTWWMCGIYTGAIRQSLQKNYHLENSPCDPCMVHCCMHWCALCQEHREMKTRLKDDSIMPMAVINPPPVQEMSASGDGLNSSSPSPNENGRARVEMQAL